MNYAQSNEEYTVVGSERDESSNYSTSEQIKIANKLRHKFNLLILILCVTTIAVICMFTIFAQAGIPIDPVSVMSNMNNLPEDVIGSIVPHIVYIQSISGVNSLAIWIMGFICVGIIASFILCGATLNDYVKIDKSFRYGRLHADLVNTSGATVVVTLLFVWLFCAVLSVPMA